jgi:hypothetical protein
VSGFRAVTTAAFTAALAVAGHALAGGGWPTGAAAALLTVVALTTGLAAGAGAAHLLVPALAVGQLGAHLALATAGHVHQTSSAPWQTMLAAHAVAVLVGAALMTLAQRSAEVLCGVIRRCATAPLVPAHPPRLLRIPTNPAPRQHVRLLAASLSHRGPPAGAH